MKASEIKSTAFDIGADLCGIAPVDRFSSAPQGFHPNDISQECRSVLVFAKKLPTGALFASSCIPYTYINQLITEEVDALRSMGIAPMEILVLPKLLALLIALPLLTVYADIMGVFGGMVMADIQLGISFSTFIERFDDAVELDTYLVGIGKAPVFAAIIATVGCFQGFQVTGSAESVGRRTTLSVVQAIFAVIIVDAAFSVAFSYLGI